MGKRSKYSMYHLGTNVFIWYKYEPLRYLYALCRCKTVLCEDVKFCMDQCSHKRLRAILWQCLVFHWSCISSAYWSKPVIIIINVSSHFGRRSVGFVCVCALRIRLASLTWFILKDEFEWRWLKYMWLFSSSLLLVNGCSEVKCIL